MRILQVLPSLSKGGAERVAVELSNSLVQCGNEVTLLLAYPVDFELNQKDLSSGVNVQFVSVVRGNRISQYLKIPFWILRHWRTIKTYDVIHCHLSYGLVFGSNIWTFRCLTNRSNIRLIATCHMVGVGVSRFSRYLNRRLSYLFDEFALMAQDDYWRSFISSKRRRNIHIVPNGVSSRPRGGRGKLNDGQKLRIGTISRLNVERKPWLFLELFSAIGEFSPGGHFRYIIGGDGPERANLELLSEKLQIQGELTFAGLVHNPAEFLTGLDIYITLNVEDITGIAGLEAVFSGVPVIGIQLSPAYRGGASDWIWSHPDPRAVAKAVVQLSKSLAERQTLAAMQYLVATKKFSIERMRDNYLDLYNKRT